MIWNPRSLLHQQTKYSATPPIQQIFLPPRFWVVTWPAATRVFLPTTKEGREERPWERGCTVPLFLCALFFFSSVPLCLLILCASVPTVRPCPFPILLRGYCSWWRQSGRRTRAMSHRVTLETRLMSLLKWADDFRPTIIMSLFITCRR